MAVSWQIFASIEYYHQPSVQMTCNMLRVHSGRLLGRQLLATSAPVRSVAASSRRLCSIAPHGSDTWHPLQRISTAPKNVASLIPGGPHHSTSWTCGLKRQFRSSDSHSSITSLTFQKRSVSSRRYATTNGGGIGNGSGIGKGGAGGGGGGSGGRSSGSGAGDEGRWRVWTWYLGLLDTNPILTKAVTSAVLTFIGDVFCQYYLEKAENLDGKRVAVMTFLGFGLVGPTLHFWYTTLSKLVTVGGAAGVGIRLVLDQFVFSPTFIATFMSCLMTLEGNPKQIAAKLKQDLWSAVLVNWQLWIPAQIINFWLVPLKLQVAFANFVALFWNAYLSWKSHLEVATPQSLPYEAKT